MIARVVDSAKLLQIIENRLSRDMKIKISLSVADSAILKSAKERF